MFKNLKLLFMKKLMKNLVLAVTIALFFIACNKDNVAPEITLSSFSDTTIRVGNQLLLEAEVVSDLVFTYQWTINDSIYGNDAVFVFTPVKSGVFNLKLVVENKFGSDSSMAVITVLPKLITVDFEELTLAANSFWNGSDGSGKFESGNLTFSNAYDQTYMYWDGFAYSNQNDTQTEGYSNQYSVFDDTNNGNKFAVFYPPYFGAASFGFIDNKAYQMQSINVCNITYTALSMKSGDFVAKKFGGESGNDEDFLKLIIKGLDANGAELSKIDFFLADFRFADNTKDYIVDKWTTVDLTSLGAVNKVTFSFESSDSGAFGINTPTYFCFDNIEYQDIEN
jgi:hypothetical protein